MSLQAIAMLHPEGMAVAAAEEAREVQAAQQAAAAAARLKTPGHQHAQDAAHVRITADAARLHAHASAWPLCRPSHALHRRPTIQRALFLMQMISR